MSQLPRAGCQPVVADRQAARVPFFCIPDHSATALPAYTALYVPLSERTSDQLLENAAELREMAATATTADVVRALLTLADRYCALAEQRRTPGPL